MEVASVDFRPRLPPEEQARADMYALLARLYADAPDQPLLSALARALPAEWESGQEGELAQAWQALTQAATAMDEDAARQEYQELFVGVGKAPVNLYGSFYLTGFMMEQPLADVRASLALLGLERKPGAGLVEDHLAALLETMRALVGGGVGLLPQSVAVQKSFFQQHLDPWYTQCCTAIVQSPVANFYRLAAKLTTIFLGLEGQAFNIE